MGKTGVSEAKLFYLITLAFSLQVSNSKT